MKGIWKYILVGVAAFMIGSATVATASGHIQKLIISNEDETRTVKVTKSDRLAMDVRGKLGVTIRNPEALRGPVGPQGPFGPQGVQGAEGPKGEAGSPGPAGPQGDTGSPGPTGPKGAKGDTGASGQQGPQGLKGDKGATGDAGPGLLAYGVIDSDGSIISASPNVAAQWSAIPERYFITIDGETYDGVGWQ